MSNVKILADGLNREVLPLNEIRETKLSQPFPETKELPFYNLLPANHVDLIRLRIALRQRCLTDTKFRADVLEMCRQDVCFFCNLFVWVFEPRPPRGIPVQVWADQADVLALLAQWFGLRDVGIEKSRGIGMSWVVCMLYVWAFLFVPEAKMGLISKDESGVDSPDENSLIGKIVYIFNHLPAWMRLDAAGRSLIKRNISDHVLTNLANNATIQGFPATDNKVRGMRFSSLCVDEMAFYPQDAQAALNTSVHTTPNRIFVSTYNGVNNAFYEVMRKETKSTLLKIRMYWWANPARWAGCYTTEKGRVAVKDTAFKFPLDYPFVTDGLLRSPWVDAELRRAGSSVQSALEELFGVRAEAGRNLFRGDTQDIVNTTVRPPAREGKVNKVAGDRLEFKDEKGGPVKLWGPHVGAARGGPYSVACDLGYGRGAAYSTVEAIDLACGEQVLEYATNTDDIVTFTQYTFDILSWLCAGFGHGHAYLTFENNGDIGNSFANEMIRLGYGNIMRRAYKIVRADGRLDYLGMRNKDSGLVIFGEMERAIRDGEIIVRSEAVLREIGLYDKDDKGRPAFPPREDGHGDRAIGLALAWWQGRERRDEAPITPEQTRSRLAGNIHIDPKQAYSELEQPKSRAGWASGWRVK